MPLLYLLPAIVSLLVLCGHLIRSGLVLVVFLVPFLLCLLLIPRAWVVRLFQLLLTIAAMEWVRTAVFLAVERQEDGRPWLRMVIILGAVAAFNIFSMLLFESAVLRRVYHHRSDY